MDTTIFLFKLIQKQASVWKMSRAETSPRQEQSNDALCDKNRRVNQRDIRLTIIVDQWVEDELKILCCIYSKTLRVTKNFVR